jgi:hypothetical protein
MRFQCFAHFHFRFYRFTVKFFDKEKYVYYKKN